MKRRGFTLIELLAVIIILGILMLIAIPSVTTYINNSRKETYVDTVKEVLKGASMLVNSGELEINDPNTTYYVPISVIDTENGEARSPYGKFDDAYVVITYDGDDYDYFFIGKDEADIGVDKIIKSENLDKDKITTDISDDAIKTDKAIGNRNNIKVVSKDDIKVMTDGKPKEYLDEEGYIENDTAGFEFPEGKTKDNIQFGEIIKIGNEEFKVMDKRGNNIVVLAKYNLMLGYASTTYNVVRYKIDPSTSGYGLQDVNSRGYTEDSDYTYGATPISDRAYWLGQVGTGPEYKYQTGEGVFDENSLLYEPLMNYMNYLNSMGARVKKISIPTVNDINKYKSKANSEDIAYLNHCSFWSSTPSLDSNYFQYYYLKGWFLTAIATHRSGMGARPILYI